MYSRVVFDEPSFCCPTLTLRLSIRIVAAAPMPINATEPGDSASFDQMRRVSGYEIRFVAANRTLILTLSAAATVCAEESMIDHADPPARAKRVMFSGADPVFLTVTFCVSGTPRSAKLWAEVGREIAGMGAAAAIVSVSDVMFH